MVAVGDRGGDREAAKEGNEMSNTYQSSESFAPPRFLPELPDKLTPEDRRLMEALTEALHQNVRRGAPNAAARFAAAMALLWRRRAKEGVEI